MKNIITLLFPYALYLHIFQLERYDISRFLNWFKSNLFTRTHQNKKPLVSTQKIKVIHTLSVIWFIVLVIILKTFAIITLIQPWILITLALITLKPYEWINKQKTISQTHKRLNSFKHVKTIGIAGSYGKTSVKDILYHLLKSHFKVLKTPLSYNTIFGIAQVVDLELDDTYDFFLCELGEFQKGDIKELCEMTLPSFGIITGINDQHLERFKHIDNTISGIFELADYLNARSQKIIVNVKNKYIAKEITKRKIDDFIVYDDPHTNPLLDVIR